METQELERRVESGAKFRISLEKRTLHINGKSVDFDENIDTDFSFEKLENLYRRYKHSLPGERDQVKKSYFLALNEEDLSDEDILYGERRLVEHGRPSEPHCNFPQGYERHNSALPMRTP